MFFDPLIIHQATHAGRGCLNIYIVSLSGLHASLILYTVLAMSNEQPGPQIPQRVDTASELYQILRERLRQLILHTLRASPEQYQNNDEANRCKEALKLWANNVGVCRGVLTILDEHKTWEMRNDMFECLWALHSAVEDMEVGVGWRPMRTDKCVASQAALTPH